MKALPKVELHIHLEGTLEPELIFELAERNGIELPYDIDGLRARYEFTDLQSFLDLYYANLSVVLTEDDFADLTRAYLERARIAGVRHVELFFDPQAHTSRGVPLAAAINGVTTVLQTSEADYGITSALIVNFLRDRPAAEALSVLEELLELQTDFIGIGLDSAEVGHPPADFAQVYEVAHANGLRLVSHAGEEGPPEYVWQALNVLHVSRIDHGIRSLEDPELVDYLVKHRIPLTVCPLSNVRLKVIDRIEDHPLAKMLEFGLIVTVNSDDPAYFGGYIDDNFVAVETKLGLSDAQLETLARNAVAAAFITDERRAELLDEIAEAV